jgi:hypothetical protein
MNTYSKALRHISIRDVKEKHQEKLIEQKIREQEEKEEVEYIASVLEKTKYNWRDELNESMTSSGMFFTTLPATGDVNLAYPGWNPLGGYNYNVSGGTVTITNSGTPGPESGVAASFDTSLYDTLVIDVGFSGDTVLGVFGGDLVDPLLVTTNPGTYSISVPQSKSQTLIFLSATLSVGTVTINNLRYQRRTPMNVFVPLDSPEATSFIRADPNLSNLSLEERNKKLAEMLSASDEYVEKMLGSGFPGTGSVPPGEYDPFKQAPAGEAGDTPGVEIAQVYPADYDMERNTDLMLLKGLQRGDYGTGPDIDKQIKNLQKNLQQGTPGGLPRAQASQLQYAHYEAQGELISERKKLKSPEEVLNKIPGYYTGKPAPLSFPVEPPAKMVNGMHSDLVDGKKVSDRFNRMDPQSAQAMPKTGNPHIDKKVEKAKKQPK